MGGFNMVWNGETKQLFGRNFRSWCDIAVYYFFYYTTLTAFYSASVCLFYQLIEPSQPRLRLETAVHAGNPGMGFRPQFPELHTTLIHRSKKMQTHNVKSIQDYLKSEGIQSLPGTSGSTNPDDRSQGCEDALCEYSLYQQDMGNCTEEKRYGYYYEDQGKHGTPCIMLKLNKLFDWEPELYSSKPKDFVESSQKRQSDFYAKFIPVMCSGESAVDKENIQSITYYPVQGFAVNGYFPYRRQIHPRRYQSPIIFAEIKTTPGVVVYVECKAFAKNIEYSGDTQETRKGSVHFELLADE